jgi:hypothetical protein
MFSVLRDVTSRNLLDRCQRFGGIPCFHNQAKDLTALLAMFAKLASSCLSVLLSAWNNSAPTGRTFMKLGIWVFFENLAWKFKVHSNRTSIKVLYMQTNIHFLSHLVQFFLEWEMFQTKIVQKIKTRIYCSITFFENRNVLEITWENPMAHALCMLGN